jgi:hypothetical protein
MIYIFLLLVCTLSVTSSSLCNAQIANSVRAILGKKLLAEHRSINMHLSVHEPMVHIRKFCV